MSVTFRPNELFDGDLPHSLLAPPFAEVIGDQIPVRSCVSFNSDDTRIMSGIWEASPGISRWEFLDRGEIIYVLGGRMVVTEDDGAAVTILAGSAAVFPIGWRGTWEIQERIRKFFVIYKL